MRANLLGNRAFILTETVGNLGKGLLGVEHQLDILTILSGYMFVFHLGTSQNRDAAPLRYHICQSNLYFGVCQTKFYPGVEFTLANEGGKVFIVFVLPSGI